MRESGHYKYSNQSEELRNLCAETAFIYFLSFCRALYRALRSIAMGSKMGTCFLFPDTEPDQEKNAVEAFHDWFQWGRHTLSQARGST